VSKENCFYVYLKHNTFTLFLGVKRGLFLCIP